MIEGPYLERRLFPQREIRSAKDLLNIPLRELVVYEDADLIVVQKTPGRLSVPIIDEHGTKKNSVPSMEELLQREREYGSDVRAVHRLDADTSGLMIFSRHAQSHTAFKKIFENGEVKKTYLALLRGGMAHDQLDVEAELHLNRPGGNKVERVEFGHYPKGMVDRDVVKSSLTRFTPVMWLTDGEGGAYTLTEVGLGTGRTHQIRAVASALGYPLVGEKETLYSSQAREESILSHFPASRHMLHAARLEFTHPLTQQSMQFTSPLMPDMQGVLSILNPILYAERAVEIGL